MRSVLGSFWGRLAIILVIGGGIYTVAILIPRLHTRAANQLPKKSLVQFRAVIDQNYIAYQALAYHSLTGKTTSLTMTDTANNAQVALQALETALKHPPKQVDSALVSSLRQAAGQEQDVLSAYSGRFNALGKPLSYIPESDLSISDASAERAKAAAVALKSLATTPSIQPTSSGQAADQQIISSGVTFQLSAKTKRALQSSADCFNSFASQLQAKSASAKATLGKCDKQYKTTRDLVAQAALEPLVNNDGKTLQSKLASALKQLDKLL